MENKFYTEHFEQFLKETVDDFRMVPSKKVWTSVYNNLHPGKKWPSITTWLLILFSISFLSIHNSNKTPVSVALQNNKQPIEQLSTLSSTSANHTNQATQTTVLAGRNKNGSSINRNINRTTSSVTYAQVESNIDLLDNANIPSEIMTAESNTTTNVSSSHKTEKISSIARTTADNVSPGNTGFTQVSLSEATATESQSPVMASFINSRYQRFSQIETYNTASLLTIRKPLLRKRFIINSTDREWMEDFAFHNKPKNKWKGRLAYQMYVTPSVGYRSMASNIDNKPITSSALNPGNGNLQAENYGFRHSPGLNLEAGGAFLLNVTRTLRLKAGMQLNYNNYKVHAHEMDHPAFTTLLLKNRATDLPELVSKASTIANISEGGNDGKKLNNNSFQISLPIGADVKLAGNDQLQWYVGASIQPGIVLGGNPYLISSDMKNYVYDPSLLRRFNVSSSFETFISYRLKNGAVLNAGPQLRYQLLSSYSSRYNYDEKLYNLGVKLGITRNF
jgi:hypothetical protein